MISDIIVGHVYQSSNGYPYKVEGRAEHGQSPEDKWVQLHNLTDTPLYSKGYKFSVRETVFKELFSCYTEGKYHEQNKIASEPTEPMLRSTTLSMLDKRNPNDGAFVFVR